MKDRICMAGCSLYLAGVIFYTHPLEGTSGLLEVPNSWIAPILMVIGAAIVSVVTFPGKGA